MERTTAEISPASDLRGGGRVLRLAEWKALESAHAAAVDELTSAHLRRRREGEKHPIIDFLFTYYRSSVGALRAWHPGPGVAIEMEPGRAELPAHYLEIEAAAEAEVEVQANVERGSGRATETIRAMRLDLDSLRAAKGRRWSRAARIVAGTRGRAPRLGCFGLHEWAMVYRLRPEEVRHEQVPLRVSPETLSRQVEGGVHCTHFDAFRFFTEPAEGLNENRLDRDSQLRTEQPACLHAGMDLYRWAAELGPACPSELRLATFRSALRARVVDMRASPYDLRDYGYDPIPVETREGRAEYVAFQRRWAAETNELRDELLALYTRIGISTGEAA